MNWPIFRLQFLWIENFSTLLVRWDLSWIFVSCLETARIFIRILILAFSYYFLAFAAAVLHDVGISGIFSKSAFCSKAYSLHWEQHSLNLGYCAKAAAVKIRFGGKNIYSEYGLNPKRRFLVIPTLSCIWKRKPKFPNICNSSQQLLILFFKCFE